MLMYAVRRLVRLVVSLLIVSVITFGLLQLVPGTYAELADVGSTGLSGGASVEQEVTDQQRDEVPAWKQYAVFMKGLFTWDMGPTYRYPQSSVEELIANAFPVSLSIAVPAMLLMLVISIP